MAKSRTRSGAAPGAPKPRIEPRRTPLTKRRWFKWFMLAALAVVVLFIVLFVLGRMGRNDALRAYDRSLAEAQQPYTKHLEATAEFSFTDLPSRFASGQATPEDLKKASEAWEADFASAARKVQVLEPPGPLVEANDQMTKSLDLYAAVAGLYGTMADLRLAMEDLTARERKPVQERFNSAVRQAQRVQGQADLLYQDARAQIVQLKVAWGLEEPAPEPSLPPDIPIPDGGIPG